MHVIEELVESDEARTLDVPMGLLHLQLQIYRIGKPLVHEGIQFDAPILGDIVLRVVGRGRSFFSRRFHGRISWIGVGSALQRFAGYHRDCTRSIRCSPQYGPDRIVR